MNLPIWGMFRQLLSLKTEEEQLNDMLNFNNWRQLKKRYVSILASNLIEVPWMDVPSNFHEWSFKKKQCKGREKKKTQQGRDFELMHVYLSKYILSLQMEFSHFLHHAMNTVLYWDIDVLGFKCNFDKWKAFSHMGTFLLVLPWMSTIVCPNDSWKYKI